MPRLLDRTSNVYSRLTVRGRGPNSSCGKVQWWCDCECGEKTLATSGSLQSGNTRSCGCMQRECAGSAPVHGMTDSPEFSSWCAMIQRCTNPKATGYSRYGGKGIKVCSRWLGSFESFYADMGSRAEGMSIDRKNNDGSYCKDNCRWATRTEQGNNKGNNHNLTYKGQTKTLTQWAREVGLRWDTLLRRLSKGWTVEEALEIPLRGRRKDHV